MMEEIPNNQLNLVVYCSIYKVLAPSERWLALGFLNHQQPGHGSRRESDLCGGETWSTPGFYPKRFICKYRPLKWGDFMGITGLCRLGRYLN